MNQGHGYTAMNLTSDRADWNKQHYSASPEKVNLINYDLVITNVLRYFGYPIFIVLLPYFWNCLCLVFVLLYLIVNASSAVDQLH